MNKALDELQDAKLKNRELSDQVADNEVKTNKLKADLADAKNQLERARKQAKMVTNEYVYTHALYRELYLYLVQ